MTAYPEASVRLPLIPNGIDRSLWIIIGAVIAAHIALIIWSASYYSYSQPAYKTPEKLIVKTITLGESRSHPRQLLAPESFVQEPIAVVEETPVQPPAAIPETPKIEARSEVAAPIPEPAADKVETPLSKPVEAPQPTSIETPPKKVIVGPKPTPKKAVAAKKKELPPKANQKPKPAPAKQIANKAPAKKPEPKKTPEVPKPDPKAEAVKAKQRELLAKAQESIGKIQKNGSKISAAKNSSATLAAMPGPIQGLNIDAISSDTGTALSATELSYRDELASRLKLLLRLPEYGDVKIKLTLERSGKVAKLVIVSSESGANRKYVEKMIPALTFPGFGSYFSGQSQYTFAITLSNDI